MPWTRDGPGGPDDIENSSENIIIQWLSIPANFERWKGDDRMGKKKKRVALELSELIAEKGCTRKRSPHQVQEKINRMFSTFKAADDWATHTGQGVKETEGIKAFEEAVKKRCPYYFELADVMLDRSSTRPPIDDIDMSAEDEEEEESTEAINCDQSITSTSDGSNRHYFNNYSNNNSTSTSPHSSTITASSVTHASAKKRHNFMLRGKSNKTSRKAALPVDDFIHILEQTRRVQQHFEAERQQLETEKWQSEKKLAAEKWKSEKRALDLNFKMDCVRKYKELQDQGYSDDIIIELFPEMKEISAVLKKNS